MMQEIICIMWLPIFTQNLMLISIKFDANNNKNRTAIKMNSNNQDDINLADQVIKNHQMLRNVFQCKIPEIHEIQTKMLLNDLKDEESKKILLGYLKSEDAQIKILIRVHQDQILMQNQKCLEKFVMRAQPTIRAKFEDFIKNAEKKCKDDSQSLTLKKQYDRLIKQAGKCFKLKVCDNKPTIDKSRPKRANIEGWKLNIPQVKIETNFVCRYCKEHFINNAGYVVHEKTCPMRPQKMIEETTTEVPRRRIGLRYNKQ